MRKNTILVILSLQCLFSGIPAHAYDTPPGAEYIGRGGINTADVNDVYALYYNPAQMSRLCRYELAAELGSLFLGMGNVPARKFAAFGGPAGALGTAGAYWSNFSVNGLYDENTFALCYGRGNFPGCRRLSAGMRVKYFTCTFHPDGAVYDDNGELLPGERDPLFRNGSSKGAFSLDAGLLYAFNGIYSIGAEVDDITEPNISFEGTSGVVLPRKFSLGLAASFSSLQCNLDLSTVANDYSGTVGVRKRFRIPLTVFGSVRYTERRYSRKTVALTEPALGIGYRIGAVFISYAATYPLNALETYGNHTLSFLVDFN